LPLTTPRLYTYPTTLSIIVVTSAAPTSSCISPTATRQPNSHPIVVRYLYPNFTLHTNRTPTLPRANGKKSQPTRGPRRSTPNRISRTAVSAAALWTLELNSQRFENRPRCSHATRRTTTAHSTSPRGGSALAPHPSSFRRHKIGHVDESPRRTSACSNP